MTFSHEDNLPMLDEKLWFCLLILDEKLQAVVDILVLFELETTCLFRKLKMKTDYFALDSDLNLKMTL